ncbi:MAG: integration host factor subunit alpha [Alphaproteobacteria bacterium]|nr:integration host factor subunit alpha [Alphaproteobacteria bacterium]
MQKTLTRADIADALNREMGFSHADSFKMIENVFGEVIAALQRGETVKISKFASFIPHAKKQRMGRNPKTGEAHAIEPRRVVSFRPSQHLRKGLK